MFGTLRTHRHSRFLPSVIMSDEQTSTGFQLERVSTKNHLNTDELLKVEGALGDEKKPPPMSPRLADSAGIAVALNSHRSILKQKAGRGGGRAGGRAGGRGGGRGGVGRKT